MSWLFTVRWRQKWVVESDFELVVIRIFLRIWLDAKLAEKVFHCVRLDVRYGHLIPVVLHADVGTHLKQGTHDWSWKVLVNKLWPTLSPRCKPMRLKSPIYPRSTIASGTFIKLLPILSKPNWAEPIKLLGTSLF